MAELRIGNSGMGITVSVTVSEHADLVRSEGWVNAEIAIQIEKWSGRYPAQFHGTDFARFAEGLTALSSMLTGEALLSSLDGYLDLTLTGDGLGHIVVTGSSWDQPRVGSHLEVSYEIDQTSVRSDGLIGDPSATVGPLAVAVESTKSGPRGDA